MDFFGLSNIFPIIVLSTFLTCLALLITTTFGVKVDSPMKNPIFQSTSPSDFWGRRWNLVIHGVLKRAVFKPVYKLTSSRFLSLIAAFASSGLFHEYLLLAMHHNDQTVEVAMFKNIAFFFWNAAVIILEILLADKFVFQFAKKTLPRPIIALLIVATALPVAHWFMHPYVKDTGFVEHLMIGFPIIRITF